MLHASSTPPPTAHRRLSALVVLASCSIWALYSVVSGAGSGQIRAPQGRAENLRVEVKGGLVDLTFDLLSDESRTPFRISVLVSTDGGATYEPTAVSLTGDVKNVTPGPAKRIVWDAGKDTDNVSLERLRYRLVAEAEQPAVPRNAGLSVSTDPPGAGVTVDGLARGSSPVKLADLAAGEHQVTLVMPGYLENSKKVTLAAGESQTLHVQLTPDPAAARPAPDAASAKTGEAGKSGKGGSPLKWVLPLAGGAAAVGVVLATKSGGDGAGQSPGGFSKVAPANGSTGASLSPTLSWNASANASSYEFCVDTTSNSTCDKSWSTASSTTSTTASGLTSGTTYYWQVRARNSTASTDADGGTWWSFRTQGVQTLTVVVPATSSWVDAMDVVAGIPVTVTATGTWSPYRDNPGVTCNPDGIRSGGLFLACGQPTCPISTANHGALIGRIGLGAPFLVGSSVQFTPTSAGRLQLVINDELGILYDNSGSVTATIRQ